MRNCEYCSKTKGAGELGKGGREVVGPTRRVAAAARRRPRQWRRCRLRGPGTRAKPAPAGSARAAARLRGAAPTPVDSTQRRPQRHKIERLSKRQYSDPRRHTPFVVRLLNSSGPTRYLNLSVDSFRLELRGAARRLLVRLQNSRQRSLGLLVLLPFARQIALELFN